LEKSAEKLGKGSDIRVRTRYGRVFLRRRRTNLLSLRIWFWTEFGA